MKTKRNYLIIMLIALIFGFFAHVSTLDEQISGQAVQDVDTPLAEPPTSDFYLLFTIMLVFLFIVYLSQINLKVRPRKRQRRRK